MFKNQNYCDGKYESLDVRFTKACDNACSFCIDKQTGAPSFGATDVDKMIQSTLSSGIKKVFILGGEPLLQPFKVLQYIKGIRSFVDEIYITTSLPFQIIKYQSICDEIFSLINGLYISIQSTSWRINNQILQARSQHNRLDILKSLNLKMADKIRVNLNLVKGGIDSKEILLHALHQLEDIGCLHIKINELQNNTNIYVSFEEIMGIKMKNPYSGGCNTQITLLPYTDRMKIFLKRSCFIVESSRKANMMDLFKAIYRRWFAKLTTNKHRVVYENGQIEKDWI